MGIDKDTQELIEVLDNLTDIFVELGSAEQDNQVVGEKVDRLISLVDSYRDDNDESDSCVYRHKIRLVGKKALKIKIVMILSDVDEVNT